MIQMNENTVEKKQNNSNRRLMHKILAATGFISSIAIMLIVRVLINYDLLLQASSAKNDKYYDVAHIGSNGVIYTAFNGFKDIYLTLMSVLFKFFGNNDYISVFVNIGIELIALIFVYFAIKNICGSLVAFIISIGVAMYPVYLVFFLPFILLWRENEIIYLCGAVGLFIISLIIHAIKKKSRRIAEANYIEQRLDSFETQTPAEEPEEKPEDIPEDKPVELLINPLPLPVKKEHKEPEYDIEVSEEDMKYDIEVSEEDMHFDVE